MKMIVYLLFICSITTSIKAGNETQISASEKMSTYETQFGSNIYYREVQGQTTAIALSGKACAPIVLKEVLKRINIKTLQYVELRCPIGSYFETCDLAPLKELKNLKELQLWGACGTITTNELEAINYERLEVLTIGYTKLDSNVVSRIVSGKRLKTACFIACNFEPMNVLDLSTGGHDVNVAIAYCINLPKALINSTTNTININIVNKEGSQWGEIINKENRLRIYSDKISIREITKGLAERMRTDK